MEAWVTSVVEAKDVDKAIVLAGSIRRVSSSKKVAVLTSFGVYESARPKLMKAFDLVVPFGDKGGEGLAPKDQAILEGFSLVAFRKCVYLCPNTMVLKNCDDIFDRYENFAFGRNGEEGLDLSIFLFTPSLGHNLALENVVSSSTKGKGALDGDDGCISFANCFQLWLKNNISKWDKLEEEYNSFIDLDEGAKTKSLSSKLAIAKFGEVHPLAWVKNGAVVMEPSGLGAIEKFVVEHCRQIYTEDAGLSSQPEGYTKEPIAIVGLSFRLPGADNVDQFWELLINGKDAITRLPPSRWSAEHIRRPCKTRDVLAGFLSAPVDQFDYKFFGISGKEAEFMDPQNRLLHEVAWEALEDAMIDPLSLRGSHTGIFVGSWLQCYRDIVTRVVDEDFFRAYVGTSIASGAARLAHFFNTVGPSIATESGCSSAMVAVDMACKSLRNRESNLAMACGVNLILTPFDNGTMNFVFSPEGRCKTFDEGADGFGRAEGCAVLLMKRLSDATRDGDNIWGLVRGSAVTQEGVSNSFGTPTVHCESLAMELALKDAHVTPLDVSFIEAHGTGTPVGDPLEIAAITKAYSRGRSKPLVIGSVKTNVGHTESVSGITGIIKVLLSMRNEWIPPHLNLKTLNPAINLDLIPALIPLEAMPWVTGTGKPRIAGVSSFGITGTDGHVIIEEAPPGISHSRLVFPEIQPRPLHIMKLSAKSPESLQQQLTTYEKLFSSKEGVDSEHGFEDIAYSANIGRATFNHRAVLIAKDFKGAAQVLENKSFQSNEVQSTGSRLCFLFTGQGTPYPNMSAELYATSPIFKDEFDMCNGILGRRYGIDLADVLWGDAIDDGNDLRRALYCQTGIFCVEYCLTKLWESWGVKPDYVMGHSLGEFAAAVTAGVLDLEDALIMLVAGRVQSIDILSRGKMLVIYADKKAVDQIIQKYKQDNPHFWADYAALNSPVQTVIAGEPKMIKEFARYCEEKSVKGTLLSATHAFHSRHMEPMLKSYRRVAETVKPLRAPKDAPKFISTLEGKLIDPEEINADYWVRHARETVNFVGACNSLHFEGCTIFVEIGPHPVLSALAMANFDGQSITCLPSIRKNQGDWSTMLDSLAKLYLSDWKGQVDWNGFDQFYKRSRVTLPFYPFNRKPAWMMLEASLPNLHPLLGRVTPTGCDHTIFENRLTLKNTPFVKDHVIGNTVVFPGAAFMEMCLAGGHAAVQGAVSGELVKPRRSVALQSLRIMSPLGMDEGGIYRLQTTSKLDVSDGGDDIKYSIDVQRYVTADTNGAGEWTSHATAKFVPVPNILPITSSNIYIKSIQRSWESADVTEFYRRLPDVGLHFGPQFQSLEMGWKSEKGLLLPVKLPEDKDGNYLIHPVVADAMIQATMLWTGKDKLDKIKLQVPVQIGEFILHETTSTSSSRYIYCETTGEGKTRSILLDDKGSHLALMTGVDFVETTVKLMEGMIQKHTTGMTKLWREVWRSTPAASESDPVTASLEPGKNCWLIFTTTSNTDVCELLKGMLLGVSRNVRRVMRPPSCTEDDIKSLVKSEFHSATEGDDTIEGIIYLWGLQDKISDRDQSQTSLPLISLVQEMTTGLKLSPRLYVVTQGAATVEGHEVTNPSGGTLQGMMKSFSNEHPELHLSCVDLPTESPVGNQVDKLFSELWITDKSNLIVAFRDEQRLLPKMISTKVNNNEPLPLPSGCDRFQLLLPKTKLISDLEFGVLPKYTLDENEVEVEIKAVALNFRDVFTVLKPIEAFEKFNSIGLDMAGVVTKVGGNVSKLGIGDRVIGVNKEVNLSLPSHIKTDEAYLVPLPPTITFAEGVTFPTVFFTAYLCLVDLAKMKRGDTVLIHTASGGVGLCAIQLAKMIGAEVIATVGSKRKENYLRNLGIKHIFHSRKPHFGKQILEVTNGRGVDIVLNSLTGEGFKEASLSALAKNGRFIEMSKLNVWDSEEVKRMRPDVLYQTVDLTQLEKSELLKLTDKLKEYLSSNSIQPIPYERFDALNIRGALTYLQKAKHIGKIVCMMPEAKIENSKITASTNLFNEESTYLVTGGLGGIGLEVVKWMLNSGAKHIAIVSRSPPKPIIANLIESWNKSGKHVVAFAVDIGDYDQCCQLFLELASPARGFPQIRGVMHAAGVLADATLENQNWTKFRQTYNPKVNGTWNLHDLTKDMLLEHFVVFSSLAASFGSPVQANHAASNSFEDSLAAYRRSIGLTATSVNWGNWGEVGVATEIDFPGIRPISTAQGLLTLETIMKTQEFHLHACNIDSFTLVSKIFPSLKSYVEDQGLFGGELTGDFIINSDQFWKDVDEVESRGGKVLLFQNLIKSTLRTILKMGKDEAIDELTEFQTLGVDSLMLLEMKNGLQNILGSRLTLNANELKDCNNTESLADRLVRSLLGEWHAKVPLPSMEELQELIAEDGLLPEHIRPSEGMELRKVSDTETVLLMGATGTVGPYILKELSQRPQVKKIICLVRKIGKVSPMERLIKRLKATNLEEQVDISKVESILGDITDDKFGLSERDYNRLSEGVDTIINCAVRAEHTAKYFKAPEGMNQDIRSVNVKSTVRILEFAVDSKLKHVFHASSMLSVFTMDDDDEDGEDNFYDLDNENGFLSEKWQDENMLDHLPHNLGYPLSKHISERLCQQAVERGIPCKTFRLPVVGGDSRDGRCEPRSNHVVLRWLTFLKLKCMPETVTPIMVVPVDHCAKLSLDAFFNPESLPDVYNILYPGGGSENKFMVRIADELGIQIKIVSMHDFIDKVKVEGEQSPIAPFMKLYRDDEEEFFELLDENAAIGAITRVAEGSKNFWRSRKLEQLDKNYCKECESTEVVMRRDIHWLKEVGLFDKYGIK